MASIKPEKGLRPMNVKRIIRRVTDNDYLFTIFTKILAVLIGLVASFYSNRFLGPQLKGELGRISSLLSIVAVTANFGLYQPYPYYKRQGEPDVLNKFLRIFLLQFIAYTVIGVIGAVSFHSFELTAVCLLAPIQVLANQLSFMMMVEDVKFKNAIFFTARITNTVITILAFYTMDRTILVALALIVVGDVITVVMALLRMKRMPNPMKADLRFAAKIVPFGFVSMITTLMLTLNYRVDTLMMGYLYHIPDTEIGFYSLGVSLSEYGWLIPDAFREVRDDGTISPLPWREATFELAGRTVRCAVASGLGNARQLLHSLQRREVHYEFVEIMACPGGCINGGGQPHQNAATRVLNDVPKMRGAALYRNDAGSAIRKSHENPVVKEVYESFLGEPGSEKANELLHTSYQMR